MAPACCNAFVHLNPYGRDAVELVVDLANRPPSTLDDLVQRCLRFGLVVDMPVEDRDLTAALVLVEQWCRLVDAPTEAARVALLNRMLAEAATHPRVTDHAGSGWHLHYRDDDVPLRQVLRALVSVGTALHLTARGMDRIGRCAAPGCARVYADTSRTGRQRYCSARCGNRDAVRRHRVRQAS
jgi:predicted RNA-binding Zn ribbon-like protein